MNSAVETFWNGTFIKTEELRGSRWTKKNRGYGIVTLVLYAPSHSMDLTFGHDRAENWKLASNTWNLCGKPKIYKATVVIESSRGRSLGDMEKPSVTGSPHLGGWLMISSSVHHGKSHADMSKHECLGARMQMAFTAKALFITGITISSRRREGGPNTTASTRWRRWSCQSGVLFWKNQTTHSHLPFLIRPLSLWNVTVKQRGREMKRIKNKKKKVENPSFEGLGWQIALI